MTSETREELIELVTPEMRSMCLEAHDEILKLQAENMMLRDDLREIRQERNDLINEVFRLNRMIREAGGKPPRKGKPALAVVKNGDGT
jgi:hypothetical protein